MTPDRSSHPSDDTFLRMACNELDAAERTAVEEHLQGCEDCRAIWSAVEHVQTEAARFDPGAIRPPEGRFTAGRRWQPLAAIAAVLVGTIGLLVWEGGLRTPGNSSVEPPPVRAMAQPAAPADLVPGEGACVVAPEFSWTAADGAAGYVVELFDDQGQPLWISDRLSATRIAWPDTVERRPGTFYWRVLASPENGGEPVASPLVLFEVVAE